MIPRGRSASLPQPKVDTHCQFTLYRSLKWNCMATVYFADFCLWTFTLLHKLLGYRFKTVVTLCEIAIYIWHENITFKLSWTNINTAIFNKTIFFSMHLLLHECHGWFLCCLGSIATHRDHFVRRLSVRPSVCLSVCHTRIAMFRRRHMHSSECCHYFFL